MSSILTPTPSGTLNSATPSGSNFNSSTYGNIVETVITVIQNTTDAVVNAISSNNKKDDKKDDKKDNKKDDKKDNKKDNKK
jgi:hypothetical protein